MRAVALPSKAELGDVGAAITARLKPREHHCFGKTNCSRSALTATVMVRLKPYGQRCSIVTQRRIGRQRYNNTWSLT